MKKNNIILKSIKKRYNKPKKETKLFDKLMFVVIMIILMLFLLSTTTLAYLDEWTAEEIEKMQDTQKLMDVYNLLRNERAPKNEEELKKYEELADAFLNNKFRDVNYGDISIEQKKKEYKEKVTSQGNNGSSNSGTENQNLIDGKYSNWKSVPLEKYSTKDADEAYTLYQFLMNDTIGIENMGSYFLEDYVNKINALINSEGLRAYETYHDGAKLSVELESKYREIRMNDEAMQKIDGTEAEQVIKDSTAGSTDALGHSLDTIYRLPSKTGQAGNSEENLEDMIKDADDFINVGQANIDQSTLTNFSKTMYNILLAVGVVVAVIVGALIGLKFMTSSIEEKVEAKKLLVPYVVGCVVVFGGFIIWKIVVTILQSI